MVELVYTLDSKPSVVRHEGSSPSRSTQPEKTNEEM